MNRERPRRAFWVLPGAADDPLAPGCPEGTRRRPRGCLDNRIAGSLVIASQLFCDFEPIKSLAAKGQRGKWKLGVTDGGLVGAANVRSRPYAMLT